MLGALGLGGVACFLYPEALTTPAVRNAIPLDYLRGLLHIVLVSAFVLGFSASYFDTTRYWAAVDSLWQLSPC